MLGLLRGNTAEDLGDGATIELCCCGSIPVLLKVLPEHDLVFADASAHGEAAAKILAVALGVWLCVLSQQALLARRVVGTLTCVLSMIKSTSLLK